MLIDRSFAPLMVVRSNVDGGEPLDEQFRHLLDEDKPFVLITDHAERDHDNETPEERKQRALFLKSVKDRMRRLCRAMIVIESGKPTPAPIRMAASAASKAFGVPILFAPSEEDAMRQGQELMAASFMGGK